MLKTPIAGKKVLQGWLCCVIMPVGIPNNLMMSNMPALDYFDDVFSLSTACKIFIFRTSMRSKHLL